MGSYLTEFTQIKPLGAGRFDLQIVIADRHTVFTSTVSFCEWNALNVTLPNNLLPMLSSIC